MQTSLPTATRRLFTWARSHWVFLGVAVPLAALCLWAYWPTLGRVAHKWVTDPQYSHGYLVPAFSLVLLWRRSPLLARASFQFSWWGVLPLAVGGLMRVAAAYLYLDWLDAVSLLPCVAGLFVLLGGWTALKWSWPAVAFLVFMIPLPHRVETALALPLQHLATLASTYALQTIGLPALAEGNTIHMTRAQIGVVEACSGLSMLLVFFAISTGMAILIKRPLLDKALIFVSAIPVALLANITRITVTGLLFEWV
ncbi:MAG TPA: exosortase/archaeosortase family protein, partial [Gemmataceae bacterium]|nr:exosortase/archaeosortase family protein [Gemmataceae bacterium]